VEFFPYGAKYSPDKKLGINVDAVGTRPLSDVIPKRATYADMKAIGTFRLSPVASNSGTKLAGSRS